MRLKNICTTISLKQFFVEIKTYYYCDLTELKLFKIQLCYLVPDRKPHNLHFDQNTGDTSFGVMAL